MLTADLIYYNKNCSVCQHFFLDFFLFFRNGLNSQGDTLQSLKKLTFSTNTGAGSGAVQFAFWYSICYFSEFIRKGSFFQYFLFYVPMLSDKRVPGRLNFIFRQAFPTAFFDGMWYDKKECKALTERIGVCETVFLQ